MAETLVNNFLLGADPELILLDPPTLINGHSIKPTPPSFYGYDHAGYVLEPHPIPAKSARQVLHNLKKSLDVATRDFPAYRFKAGAYYQNENQRSVTLGGHVHLDIPTLTAKQIRAMDLFGSSLESLDILPSKECRERVATGLYGRKGDIRAEHGHVEYRSLCSWLFSRKTSMLCMTGIKLCAIAPESLKLMDSISSLKSWIEEFKGKDDDVDWILNRGYFNASLEARPDSDVKNVWRADPSLAKEWDKEAVIVPEPPQRAPLGGIYMNPDLLELRALVEDHVRLTQGQTLRLQYTFRESASFTKRELADEILRMDRNNL